jgi:hypothetical protein
VANAAIIENPAEKVTPIMRRYQDATIYALRGDLLMNL